MMSREIPVKLTRVIQLFGIVCAGIIALAITLRAFFFVLPTIETAVWHLQHGNHLMFEGHTFEVPLSWRVSSEPFNRSIEIVQSNGEGLIDLVSMDQVLDASAARNWQSKSIADFAKFDTPISKTSGKVIRGKNFEFVCFSIGGGLPYAGEMLECRVSGTNMRATIMQSEKSHKAVKSIIDSAR